MALVVLSGKMVVVECFRTKNGLGCIFHKCEPLGFSPEAVKRKCSRKKLGCPHFKLRTRAPGSLIISDNHTRFHPAD